MCSYEFVSPRNKGNFFAYKFLCLNLMPNPPRNVMLFFSL